jgi:general secretion pathway protein K
MVALATILAATIAKHQRNTAESTAYLMRQNQLIRKKVLKLFSELLVDDAQNAAEVNRLQKHGRSPCCFSVEDGFVSGRLEDEVRKI